ncbi:DNA-3-methyladenine glycosylase [Rhizobium rhizosphaerae]|uniref:DNA-3-methyladenine glycosylase n=1 Tax=Xaviernesmea rhizosphaerae TaxID=1672749 RepID=UPI00098F21A4|nr:DNA-3-methyladenine glycosylase [Xaviernesmea rhizosphaerae]
MANPFDSSDPARSVIQTALSQFFDADVLAVAPGLIGAVFTVDGVGGVIVETEAYRADDPASHSFAGPTERNRAMFGPPGTAYVYRSYGIHWCFNIVCRPGSAVLLRALSPVLQPERMALRRGRTEPKLLCSGPGRLCQALGIDLAQNGLPLDRAPFTLRLPEEAQSIEVGPRIGITKAADRPWRFGLKGSPFLSRRFAATPPQQ